MKTLTKLILVSLLFSNCNNKMEKDCLICELQGDWIGKTDEEILIIDQDRIVENQPWLIKYLDPFRIQNNQIIIDSIRFKRNDEIKKYAFDIRYEIESLSNDTLTLIKYKINDTTERERLKLERLTPQYKYEFKRLSISGSPCLGYCPQFQIEIESTKDVKFQGGSFNKRKGNYVGTIEEDDFELIQNQIDKVYWEELEDSYWKEVTDIQYFNIEMEDVHGKKYFVTTNSPESKALNILIFRTYKIIEQSELVKTNKALEFSTDLKHDKGDSK